MTECGALQRQSLHWGLLQSEGLRLSGAWARLDGHAQRALDCARRLAQDGQVRGAAAAPDSAAAPVEQRQLHAMPLRHGRQLLLCSRTTQSLSSAGGGSLKKQRC